MELGDFFSAGPHCAPVAPKPFRLRLVAKGATLPGGEPNKEKRQVRGEGTACFVFVDAEEQQKARLDARRDARERAAETTEDDAVPAPISDDDVATDYVYQVLVRAIRVWDEKEKRAGGPLFPSAAIARELMVDREASRVFRLYNEYVTAEHPEDPPSQGTFRRARGGGDKAPRA